MLNDRSSLLGFVTLQGAMGTLAGFIGFFVVGNDDLGSVFGFTGRMLSYASLSALLAYALGPFVGLSGKWLMKLGFALPGVLLVSCSPTINMMALAFGSFLGLTWSARYWLEMGSLDDAQRDGYASRSGSVAVIGGIVATLAATAFLAKTSNNSAHLYQLYGAVSLVCALVLGKRLPSAPMRRLKNPVGVLLQREFIACFPLFFLESGLLGLGGAVGAIGAAKALGSATEFGWVSTVAGFAGGVALHLTQRNRRIENRTAWLFGSCAAVALSFLLLGASAWLPGLYVASSILSVTAGPFLNASENVLNQRALDIEGELADRIVARDLVMWAMRVGSLLIFWLLASRLSSNQMLAIGSLVLAAASMCKYFVGTGHFNATRASGAPGIG